MNIPPELDNEMSATSYIGDTTDDINSVISETYFMVPSRVSVEGTYRFFHEPTYLPAIDHTTYGLYSPLIPPFDDVDFAAFKPLRGDTAIPSHLFGTSPDDLIGKTLLGDVRGSIGINVDVSLANYHSAIMAGITRPVEGLYSAMMAESMESLHFAIMGGAVHSVENLRSVMLADATKSIQSLHSAVFASAIEPVENWRSTLLAGITKPVEDLQSTILSGATAPINSLSSAMLGGTVHAAERLCSAMLAPFSQGVECLSTEFSYSSYGALGQLFSTEATIDAFRLPDYSASHVFADGSIARHQTEIHAYTGFGRERTGIDSSILQESLAEQLWALVHHDHISPKEAHSYYRMLDTEPHRLQHLLAALPMQLSGERNVHAVSHIEGNVVTGGDFVGRDKIIIIAHTVNIHNH